LCSPLFATANYPASNLINANMTNENTFDDQYFG